VASARETPSRARPLLFILAYLGILGLLSLLLARRDREVQWHARNGLMLFATVAGVAVAATVIGVVVPSLSCIYAVAMLIVSLLYASIVVLAIVKALDGQRLFIPWISRHASRFAD
jgi:uncharacterized membrane protein